MRVLIVDDNSDTALSTAVVLRLDGHDCRAAFGGPQALDLAKAFRPEAAILDIWLPSSSGYDLARQFRREAWGNGILLIATTGWGHDAARRRSEEAGFDHHLVKPVDLNQLRRILRAKPGVRQPQTD